jgi:mono/diheme cytochrome c family protein
MMNNNKLFRLAKLPLLIILAALTAVLIGMINFVEQTTAQEIALPTAPPDAAAGLVIYNQRCIVCHGALGDGKGTQAVQAGLEPAVFADPAYRLTAVPSLMFDKINNGNLPTGMPPFGEASSNPLSEEDIWNMVAVAYSFSTRPADIEAGQALAVELGADVASWPDLEYWFSRSNEMVLADLATNDLFGVDLTDLSDDEKLSLVDYGRSLNYNYTDTLAAFAPVEQATLLGQVINGTTNEIVTEGEVRLRAFTIQLEEMYTETVPINEDGSFEFVIENVPADWVFLADVVYGDMSFNSNAVQVSNEEPVVQMPIFVYDTTADPSVVEIDRLHMIFTFAEDQLLVSELYVFSNLETAVFVGESGNIEEGTVKISLPAGAGNVNFQRGFGASLDSFIPANEFIQTDTGWADTIPLRPGANSLNLLVNYDLPYDDGLLLAHPLPYPTVSASVIMAEVGVTITDSGWEFQGSQPTPTGSFLGYINNNIAGANAVSLTLDGRPTEIVDAQGNPVPVRDQTNELIIGGAVLAITLAVGFYLIRRWRTEPVPLGDTAVLHMPTTPQASRQGSEVDDLLQTIADLDNAYEAGELKEADYQQQRQDLKQRLTAVWK